MTTIVNNPPTVNTQPTENENNNYNWLFGILALILFFVLFVYFVVPILRRTATPAQINVPDKIDVNVNTPSK